MRGRPRAPKADPKTEMRRDANRRVYEKRKGNAPPKQPRRDPFMEALREKHRRPGE